MAVLPLGLLAACGGNGSSNGTTAGRLSLRAVWQRAAQAGGAPQFSSQLPEGIERVQIVFASAPGSNGTLRCCVKVNPVSVQQDGDHLVVVNDLTLGPATITLFGFPTAVAPAPEGFATTCSTNPASVGEPCDPQPGQPPALATYQSNPQSIVVSAEQTDTPLIELFAVNPNPTATATAMSGPTDTPTETPTQGSTTATPSETPTPATSGTPTPTLTQGQMGTATSTSTETPTAATPTATGTSTPAPIDISGQWVWNSGGQFPAPDCFSCNVTIVQTGTSYMVSGPCESCAVDPPVSLNPISVNGTIDTTTGDFSGTGTGGPCGGSFGVSGATARDGNSLGGTFQCSPGSSIELVGGRSAVFTPTPTNTAGEMTATPTVTSTATPTLTPTACTTSVTPGSIVVFENLQVTSTGDPILSLTNLGNAALDAYCFYADTTQPTCTISSFNVALSGQSSIRWQAGVGSGSIPAVPAIPFAGELVCVQVDSMGTALIGNHLAGTLQSDGQCTAATSIPGNPDLLVQNNVLCLGNATDPNCPLGPQYGSCPADIDPARIEGCWSQSQFSFKCGTPAGTPTATPTATPTPTLTPTPTATVPTGPTATRTVAPAPGAGPVSAYAPASMLVFPLVQVDSSKGIDTVIQMTAISTAAVFVHCFYEDTTSHCSSQPAQACTTAAQCPAGGTCNAGWSTQDFITNFNFASFQPTGWRASIGSTALSFPMVPPVREDPFVGLLRCFVVDAGGIAVGKNALIGEATIERSLPGVAPEIARYNALGIPASTTGNGDSTLTLGDEYSACPATLVLNNFFDGATDPVLGGGIGTTLAIVPCSVNYASQQPATAAVQYTLFNELEQQFSEMSSRSAQQVTPLAGIGSSFTVGMAGTLTGQVRLNGSAGGILAIALEAHRESTGLNTHLEGTATSPDAVVVPPPVR